MIATVCVAQDENPISHELEGIQKKIDKADQDLEKRKKELSNDPSLDPLKGDFQSKRPQQISFTRVIMTSTRLEPRNLPMPRGSRNPSMPQPMPHWKR